MVFKPGTNKTVNSCSTTKLGKQEMKLESEFFMSVIQIDLMINSLMVNQLRNMS